MAALTSTVHDVLPPVQAPDQPWKMPLGPGAADSVTLVGTWKDSVHAVPQLMPAGELVTVPSPLVITVKANGATHGPNVMEYGPAPPYTMVWSIFDGTSGCGGVVTAGVGFSSLEKP